MAKLKVVLVVPGTTVDYLSKFFSVSKLIANVVSAFVDKLHNLTGWFYYPCIAAWSRAFDTLC